MLAAITIGLVLITLISFIVGLVGLTRYAARLGTGTALLVLLCPPYAFYFSFYKLQHEDKDRPTAMWLFGLFATILLVFVFWAPLSAAMKGDWSGFTPDPEQEARKAYVPKPDAPAPTPTPAPTPAAAADQSPDAAPAAPTDPNAPAAAPADGQPAAAPAPAEGQPAAAPAPAAAPTGDQAAPAAPAPAAPAPAAPAPTATP